MSTHKKLYHYTSGAKAVILYEAKNKYYVTWLNSYRKEVGTWSYNFFPEAFHVFKGLVPKSYLKQLKKQKAFNQLSLFN